MDIDKRRHSLKLTLGLAYPRASELMLTTNVPYFVWIDPVHIWCGLPHWVQPIKGLIQKEGTRDHLFSFPGRCTIWSCRLLSSCAKPLSHDTEYRWLTKLNTSFVWQGDDIILGNVMIKRVQHAKLLGVVVSRDLRWQEHVDYVCCRGSQHLYFLRMLKRAGVEPEDIVKMYTSLVCPVLQYACQVWHTGLTVQ